MTPQKKWPVSKSCLIGIVAAQSVFSQSWNRWNYPKQPLEENIARIANAVTITLYSRVTMSFLILLFPIVRNVSSVSSVKFQVTSLEDGSFRVFSKCLCLCLCLCLCQVMSPHHSDQMSQRSKVSGVAIWGCSPNVIVIVIVFVFVFVIVFLFVRSCLLITLITCLKGHKSLRMLFGSVFQQCVGGREVGREWQGHL